MDWPDLGADWLDLGAGEVAHGQTDQACMNTVLLVFQEILWLSIKIEMVKEDTPLFAKV